MADREAPIGLSALITGQTQKADIAKINRNIQRMTDQHAPQEDIDDYIQSEGMTPKDYYTRMYRVKKNGAGANVLQGVTFGFGDEIVAGGAGGIRGIYDPRTGEWFSGDVGKKYDELLAEQRQTLEDARALYPYQSAALEAGGSMLTAGGMAKTGLSLGANAIKNGAGLGRVAVESAKEGAVLGGAYGFGSGEGGIGNRAGNAVTGAVTGGIGGAAVPYVTSGAGRMVSPFVTSPQRNAMANILEQEGVHPSAGQRTGSFFLRSAESQFGGHKAAGVIERQGEQYTAAALRRAGVTADRASPKVIDDAFTGIDAERRGIAAHNNLMPDRQLVDDLTSIQNYYASRLPETVRAPIIGDTINDILRTIGVNGRNGTPAIEGASFHALSSYLDKAARDTANPELTARALHGIREALDDAMERSIAQTNPRYLGAWQDQRNRYHNLLVIKDAAAASGDTGSISPSQLGKATANVRNYAQTRGDFDELANSGAEILKPLPKSGSEGRSMVKNLGATAVSSIIGGAGGNAIAGVEGANLGTIAGAATPEILGALMMSKAGQAYLANQVMRNVTPERRALVNALIVNATSNAASQRSPEIRALVGTLLRKESGAFSP